MPRCRISSTCTRARAARLTTTTSTGGTPPPGLTLIDRQRLGERRHRPTARHADDARPLLCSGSRSRRRSRRPASGDRADRLFEITIGPAPLAIKTSSLRRGVVGAPYTETLTASGGGSQTWSATGLPPGLAVSGSTITGTPTDRRQLHGHRHRQQRHLDQVRAVHAAGDRSAEGHRPRLASGRGWQAVHGRLPGDRRSRDLLLGGDRGSRGPDVRR